MTRIAVAGGGISGLSAAYEAMLGGADVVVFEAADRIGGKLLRSDVPGLGFTVDEGADAFLARVPDALDLCDELGIDDLVHPATGGAWVHAGDGLVPLPKGQLLGIPTDLDEIEASGLVSTAGVIRARQDLERDDPPLEQDLSVGALVRNRLGDEVCDHLVEPLLGGINGGEADGLSLQAAAAEVWQCARLGGSLIRAAAAMKAKADPTAPVFATPTDGMASLPEALAARVLRPAASEGQVELRRATPLTTVTVDERRRVLVGDEVFDGLVLATPADVAGSAIADVVPPTASRLRATTFASVVLVTLVVRRDQLDHPLDGSGFVVARTVGRAITACSWGSSKWAHWDDGTHVVLRASLGHDGDERDWTALDDDLLVDTVVGDLGTIMGVEIPPVVGSRVSRWPRSFPQYRPGHLDRLAETRAELAEAGPITVAGMSHDGIGVPACIRSGRTAARTLLG